MAFPSVRSSNSGTTAATSHVVPMPGTIVAGDLLVIAGRFSATTGAVGTPSGWTIWANDTPKVAWNKIAAGGDTATVTTVNFVGASWVSICVQDWFGTLATGFQSVSSATNNPASLTPAWGADDNLWIEMLFSGGGTLPSISAWSTNYTEIAKVTGDFAADTFMGMASRQLNATSEDPNAITSTGSPTLEATRFAAVRPAGAASTENPYPYIGGGYYPVEG